MQVQDDIINSVFLSFNLKMFLCVCVREALTLPSTMEEIDEWGTCSVFNYFFSMWWNVYHWDYNMLNELNVTLSFISVHNWVLVALRTAAEAFYASCVCLRFNGSVVVIISVSFQRFIQWQARVIHQDFLLRSVPCLKEWIFVCWTWMFLKLSLSMFH